MERGLAAILSMDVVGYSRLMAVDEAGTLGRRKDLRVGVVEPLFERHGRCLVKLMGDGALVEYAGGLAAEIGFELEECEITGGMSDGKFTAALGVPTLDGGDGAGSIPTTSAFTTRRSSHAPSS